MYNKRETTGFSLSVQNSDLNSHFRWLPPRDDSRLFRFSLYLRLLPLVTSLAAYAPSPVRAKVRFWMSDHLSCRIYDLSLICRISRRTRRLTLQFPEGG